MVPIRDQLRAGIAWPVLALLLTLLAVWIGINKLVVRWLRELGRLARQFAQGDYSDSQQRFAGAPTEIVEVGADMHHMAKAITQRSDELAASVSATRSMAREINHRVKNNLQMIISLIALQAARVQSDEARRVLDQTRGRMSALALIHRLLYERSEEADQGEVDMDRLFSEMCNQLRHTMDIRGNVMLHCQAAVGTRPIDEAVPVALLVVEAVTNVYRHAFPSGQSGAVWVSLSKTDDVISLQVSDRGVGYDMENTPTSMGTELMRGFVEQLNGKLVIDAGIQKGVTIKLDYPAGRIMKMAR